MNISEHRLDQFIRITKKVTGKDITRQEAREQADKLLNLIKLTRRPVPQQSDKV